MTEHDELPPHARAVLYAARDCDDPTPADQTRVAAALAPKLAALGIVPALLAPAPLAAAPAVAGAAAAGGGLGLSAKLALVLVGAGIAAGGFVHAVREHRTRAPMQQAAPSARPRLAAPARAPLQRQPDWIAPQPPAREAVVVEQPAAPAPAPALTAQPSSRSHAAFAAPRRAARALDPSATESTTMQPVIAPEPVSTAVVDDSLREELALIERANTALRLAHAAEALRALDEHAQRFEHGMLSEERRGLRVLALCALAPNQAALDARSAFLREAPNALLAPKVREACSTSRGSVYPKGAR